MATNLVWTSLPQARKVCHGTEVKNLTSHSQESLREMATAWCTAWWIRWAKVKEKNESGRVLGWQDTPCREAKDKDKNWLWWEKRYVVRTVLTRSLISLVGVSNLHWLQLPSRGEYLLTEGESEGGVNLQDPSQEVETTHHVLVVFNCLWSVPLLSCDWALYFRLCKLVSIL